MERVCICRCAKNWKHGFAGWLDFEILGGMRRWMGKARKVHWSWRSNSDPTHLVYPCQRTEKEREWKKSKTNGNANPLHHNSFCKQEFSKTTSHSTSNDISFKPMVDLLRTLKHHYARNSRKSGVANTFITPSHLSVP
ncbi:hypothetical protein VNO80_20700 [Phaseolus coccineus]|uniref:Uncharacterized protein n=1 Tax=Phaseolus coccineus TaxID=3886 RepID=A0AAN9M115_PHACN